MNLRRQLLKLPRGRRIALAVPGAARWLARADTCREDETRAYLTERLFKHLAAFELDIRADVIEAIDVHLGQRRRRERALAKVRPHDAGAHLWARGTQ